MLWEDIFSLGYLLILVFPSFFVCETRGCGDCCSNTTYKSINEPRRSTKAVLKAGEKPLCDRGLSLGWYRFTTYTGGKIPEWKVPEDHCGTQAPVWLNGKHPEIKGENVVRETCIHVFGDGCWERFDINITNCGDYFVYYLRPFYYCAVAYCAGEKEPCPYGKEGEHPDCFDPPQAFSSKNLGDPRISFKDDENVEVTLLCRVKVLNGIGNWRNVSYQIEWFADGVSLLQEEICGGLPKGGVNARPCPGEDGELFSALSGEKYKIGQWISCNVSAKFTTSPKNVWSKTKAVIEPFYAGLQFYPRTTRLNSIPQATCGLSITTITITPTIPARQNGDKEWPKISFWLPFEIQLVDKSQCDTELRGTQSITLRIKATCPAAGASEGLKAIIPKITNIRHSSLWNPSVGLPTIWVTVIKPTDTLQTCRSFGDPHFTTLDWNSGYYNFMGLGDYIMYRNKERNFEVHVRHWACNWDKYVVSCNCGVVLRDHNDVIELSCCNAILDRDTTTPLTLKIRSKKCLAPGISIKNKYPGTVNGQYEVLFPSGSKVVITRGRWGLDVTLETPRAKSTSNEDGLCLYKGPRSATVTTEGYKSRLNPSESYFDTLPSYVKDNDVQYSEACSCFRRNPNTAPECDNVFKLAFPTLARKNMQPISPRNLCDRQKRDLHYTDDATDEDFQLFKEVRQWRPRVRREVQIGPFSRKNASRYCAERISETKIGKLCAKLGVDVQSLVATCSDDVVYSGDLSFATGNVAALIDECGELGARNLSGIGNNSSEETTTVENFVEEIAELLCPNDCTFNGKCVNGSCICNKDYTAEDCSTSIYQIPIISRLQGDGLCDRRKRPCKKVTVFGRNFLNSTNITCHVKEFKVVNGSWTPNNTEQRYPGKMTDLVLADCYLPESPVTRGYFHETDQGTPAAGLTISVSNDGERLSRENLTFISYDSACMNCSVSSGCLLKSNSCFINRYCFAPNETNPIDWCYQCLPDVSTNSWTKRQANNPPTFSRVTEYFAVFQETLELTIDVVDPEGMPVTVSLKNGSPNKAIVADNVLIWNATNDAMSHFYLKATDACQAISYVNITVSLVACQCQNNGSCVPHPDRPRGSGYYECDCVPGFTGDNCDINIDDCQSYPCFRGRCIDGLNNYTCSCDPGYVGSNCDTDYDDCSSSPCIHGSCTDYTGAYRCTCDTGYSGPNCTIDIDECESSPCRNGDCVDQVNNYTCQCQDGYAGHDCEVEIDECQSSPCIHGVCLDKINSFICVCPTGYTGVKCEEDINDCLSSPCGNGICVDLLDNYTCNCYVGFTGPHCDIEIKNCTIDSCYPNVTCFQNSDTISCGPCPLGFSGDGKNCADIDYCVSHACNNGGSCVDGISNYSCSCNPGYAGDHCERDIDDCVNHKCGNGGSCIDGVNNYSCNCLLGFTGGYCELDIDDCVNHTCNNGGSCEDGVNSYSCSCPGGYTGYYCETDIDYCMNHSCQNGGSCVDGRHNYSCKCPKGYTGNTCETDIDDCVNHTCSNGGSCIDSVNNYSCNCLQGFTGGLCETDIDDCVNHTCSNGGSCEDGVNSYSCNCPGGYTGGYCETDIDYCINHTCQNGGSCVDGLHNYSCKCPVGYTGSNCITEISSTATTIASPTSSATRGTSSVQPTTGQPETKFVVELRIQRTWNEDLENENSEAFKELSQILVIQISEQYSQEDNFVRVEMLSFRPGSVLAQFQLLFKNEIGDERALTPLKRAVLDGKLGSLTVDPESLKIMRDFEEPTKEDKGKVPYPLIIGASCGGVFFLAILIICLIRYWHRRKMESRRRVLGVLPGEGAFPNSKKYELQEIKSEEDHARYEEIGMWKDKVSYTEIPISQDAARYEKLKLSNSAIYQELQGTPNVDCDYEEIHTSNDALRHQETSLL